MVAASLQACLGAIDVDGRDGGVILLPDAGKPDSGFDAGRPDGGLDGGPPDASTDGGPPDASTDGGPPDASTDGGPPDASTDGGRSPVCAPGQARPCVIGVNADLLWYDRDAGAVAGIASTCGAKWLRVPFRWVDYENQRDAGSFRDGSAFAQMDTKINIARDGGREVLGLIMSVPAWASGQTPGVTCAYPDGGSHIWCDSFPPLLDSDWVHYVSKTAAHFKGRVRAWEILNEVNGCEFYRPAPNAVRYAQLLRLAFNAIRASDPSALVVAAGLQENGVISNPWSAPGCSVPGFLERLYDAGFKGAYDAIAIHPYTDPVLTPPLSSLLAGTASVMAAHGDKAPIWLTEIGLAASSQDGGQAPFIRSSMSQVRAFNQSDAGNKIETYFWYRVADKQEGAWLEEFGLVDVGYTYKAHSCAALRDAG